MLRGFSISPAAKPVSTLPNNPEHDDQEKRTEQPVRHECADIHDCNADELKDGEDNDADDANDCTEDHFPSHTPEHIATEHFKSPPFCSVEEP